MGTEIEHEECDAKWNGTGIRVRGLEWGSGIGDGEHETSEYRNMKRMGERDQGWRYERTRRNDKAGDNGPNRAGPGDPRRLHAGSKTQPELGR